MNSNFIPKTLCLDVEAPIFGTHKIIWISAFSGKFEQSGLKRGSDRALIKSDFFSNFSDQWYQYCLFRRRESLRLRRTKRDLVKKQEYMIEQLEQYRYSIEQLE